MSILNRWSFRGTRRRLLSARGAGSFEAFRAHVAESSAVLGPLLAILSAGAGALDISVVEAAAAKIQAWAKTESDWENAHAPAGCYANVYSIWGDVRTHAEQAAACCLAGWYDQSGAEIDRMTAASTSLAEQLSAVT